MNTSYILQLHPNDNIAIAKSPLISRTPITEEIATLEDIPAAHKVALKDIFKGEAVLRYGQIIGFATQNILAGQHVHIQNLAIADFF